MLINNKSGCMVVGKVSRDPETRETTKNSVTKFSVLYGQDMTQEDANGRHPGKFLDIDVWGRPGEVVASTVQKGDYILASGILKNREYEGKTYWSLSADIVIPSLTVIDAIIPVGSESAGAAAQPAPYPQSQAGFSELPDDDGDFPF